eukprot:CAMPEP_0202859972 /NCGR_PEP_ID=MMETSP1391-20130828/1873_1 /ASSEMBLY_ACC=CAM_ASM_000867 /TAXON_ID=1034604 /ORGANISM="Chlamydomonas leiostraca, Strain SAG 11-49" /LENGTH=344 /DNA_ID=CAMNT_0049539089 /DNA_START=77 /DNA_END=1111 /DNA_ORIENTATION=+
MVTGAFLLLVTVLASGIDARRPPPRKLLPSPPVLPVGSEVLNVDTRPTDVVSTNQLPVGGAGDFFAWSLQLQAANGSVMTVSDAFTTANTAQNLYTSLANTVVYSSVAKISLAVEDADSDILSNLAVRFYKKPCSDPTVNRLWNTKDFPASTLQGAGLVDISALGLDGSWVAVAVLFRDMRFDASCSDKSGAAVSNQDTRPTDLLDPNTLPSGGAGDFIGWTIKLQAADGASYSVADAFTTAETAQATFAALKDTSVYRKVAKISLELEEADAFDLKKMTVRLYRLECPAARINSVWNFKDVPATSLQAAGGFDLAAAGLDGNYVSVAVLYHNDLYKVDCTLPK